MEKKSIGSYMTAQKLGIMDECTKHMKL